LIEILWAVLFVLALLSVLANAASLAQGVRLRTRVRAGLRLGFGAYAPQTAVVLPVRGTDEGLRENVAAILSQAHPAFRVLVVADDGSDAAVAVVRDVSSSLPHVRVDVIRADPDGMGGKVNALRTALDRLEPGDEAVVFADADIRPSRDWLHQLLQPLADPSVGASTGFRWYVPPRPAVWALVRAEWNAVSANVLFDPRRSFAWGGSCAVRREDLLRLRLGERWRSVLSDDLVLTRAVREAGLRIEYAPAALVATHEGGDRAMCLEWCLRQMTMASLYLPVVRTYATAAFAVFDGAIVLGIASLVLAALASSSFLVPAALFLVTVPASLAKASLRRRALFLGSPPVAAAWKVPALRSAVAVLSVPWVMAYGLLRTRRPEVVRWRGRTYDVRDPERVRLLPSDAPPPGSA